MAERTGERWFEAELHRLRGECLMAIQKDAYAAVDSCFRRAIDAAQAQHADCGSCVQRRAGAAPGRAGKRAEARDLLAPSFGWFTEGFATADLQDAKALLDALS